MQKPVYLPVQIFLSTPVVFLSFISRFALIREEIDSNTTGWQKKIWTGKEDQLLCSILNCSDPYTSLYCYRVVPFIVNIFLKTL